MHPKTNPVEKTGSNAGAEPEGPVLTGVHRIDETHSNRHARLPHIHERELELLYIDSGAGYYMVNGRIYSVRAGDLIICSAGVPHGEDPAWPRQMRSCSIALEQRTLPGCPPDQLTAGPDNSVLPFGAQAETISQLMALIHQLYHREPDSTPERQRSAEICRHAAAAVYWLALDRFVRLSQPSAAQSADGRSAVTAAQIRRYLDEHYRKPLSLETIGHALNISPYHLAHLFKKEMGLPPMQYVMKRRMGEAQTLLMDTAIPVAEIAAELGYSNPWNFSSAFRRCVGMNPSEYRRAFRQMNWTEAGAR